MLRFILAGLLMAGVVATGLPDTAAQEKKKKAQPKKERISIADPKEAAGHADFAIQGEYEGEAQAKDKTFKVGAQVVSKGVEAFDVRLFGSGLPGDGSNNNPFLVGSGERRGKEVTLALHRLNTGGKPDGDKVSMRGTINDGKMVLRDGRGDVWGTLEKVHRKSKTIGAKPPEGAVVLFAKPGDESNWNKGKLMELSEGTFLTTSGTGGIKSKQSFGACKTHIEFRTPWMPDSFGQQRGNSGVYIQDRYECQVLDSFGLSGENNECGGIYTQHKPIVNMCYPPLSWQTYDIEFTPAVFEGDKKTKNARATIYHNGVKIHDDVEFPRETPGGQKEGPSPGPFQFQDHGNPVVYRNVWVVAK